MLNFRADLSGKCFVEFVDADMASKAVAAVNGSVTHNDATFKVSLARASGHKDSKKGRQERTLWIGNVDYNTEEWKLEDYFSECGEVEKITMPRNEDGRGRGFAFVMFADRSSMDCGTNKNGMEFERREIVCRGSDDGQKQRRDEY